MALIFGCSTAVVVISLISLAFLIIATITSPATSALGLAEAEDLRYGALGYCNIAKSSCVTGSPSYKVSSLTKLTDWKMDDNARDTLAKILIVIPVAAFLTLVSFLFNLFAHFKVFGGSLVFYIFGFVFTLLAFFGSAISVVIVFMLFYPHVKWPAWLLIGSGVLNLIAVPLVFFALRTTPKSANQDYDDEFAEEKNLTDLSDGDNFKRVDSIKLDDFPQPPTKTFTNTSSEKNPYNLKVITDNSSSSGDQFDKVSIQDYSRGNDQQSNAYRGYYNPQSTATENQSFNEGTPNLVSAQNYNKGGAIRSEAPTFTPQSAKPDFSNTPYPSTHYSTNPPTSSLPLTAPQLKEAEVGSHHGSTTGSQPGVTGISTHPSLLDEEDSDIELANDDDSDFTSVSQRAANPHYYRTFKQGPSLFPNSQQPAPLQQQQQQQQQLPPPPQQQIPQQNQYQQQARQHFAQQQTGYYQGSGYPAQGQQLNSPGPASHYSGYSSQQYQQPVFNQGYQPPVQAQPVRNTSDVLLSANPDFMIAGPASQRQTFAKRDGNAPLSGGYRPAYKRIQTANKNIAPASFSADSPYNFR